MISRLKHEKDTQTIHGNQPNRYERNASMTSQTPPNLEPWVRRQWLTVRESLDGDPTKFWESKHPEFSWDFFCITWIGRFLFLILRMVWLPSFVRGENSKTGMIKTNDHGKVDQKGGDSEKMVKIPWNGKKWNKTRIEKVVCNRKLWEKIIGKPNRKFDEILTDLFGVRNLERAFLKRKLAMKKIHQLFVFRWFVDRITLQGNTLTLV